MGRGPYYSELSQADVIKMSATGKKLTIKRLNAPRVGFELN